MSKTDFSLSASARIVGITRDTLRSHIKKRSISTIKDANGNPRIEASELIRVYGNDYDLDFEAEKQRGSRKKNSGGTKKTQIDDAEVANLKDRLEREQKERTEERKRHDAQIEELLKALATSQENHNQTLLLQDQSKGAGDFQQELKDLKRQIADQHEKAQKEINDLRGEAKKREDRLRVALKFERNKPWWQRIGKRK